MRKLETRKSWGLEYDGKLENFAEREKPRRIRKNVYNSALIALGWKSVPVRIIREKDYQRLLRAQSNGSDSTT